MSIAQDYDVIIVGAGLVGLACACALADTSLRVAVLDHRAIAPFALDEHHDLRVYAINRASARVFKALGVWSDMVDVRVCPYQKMYVWDQRGRGEITFDCQDLGESQLGYIIEHRVICNALLNRLSRDGRVDLLPKKTLMRLRQVDGVQLFTEENECYQAKLVVGADGGQSWIREQASMQVSQLDYQQRAIVATVATEQAHQATAWQCFTDQGPLALLPLADPNRCSIVWSTPTGHAETLLAQPEAKINQALTTVYQERLGSVTLASQALTFPLVMRHAKRYCDSRVVLVGDAAHTIHPLAGQGVNLGFMDVLVLSDIIKQQTSQQKDLGDRLALRRFERRRKGHNMAMSAAMTGFKYLFDPQPSMVTWCRNAGLTVADKATPIKRWFMQLAMGD